MRKGPVGWLVIFLQAVTRVLPPAVLSSITSTPGFITMQPISVTAILEKGERTLSVITEGEIRDQCCSETRSRVAGVLRPVDSSWCLFYRLPDTLLPLARVFHRAIGRKLIGLAHSLNDQATSNNSRRPLAIDGTKQSTRVNGLQNEFDT